MRKRGSSPDAQPSAAFRYRPSLRADREKGDLAVSATFRRKHSLGTNLEAARGNKGRVATPKRRRGAGDPRTVDRPVTSGTRLKPLSTPPVAISRAKPETEYRERGEDPETKARIAVATDPGALEKAQEKMEKEHRGRKNKRWNFGKCWVTLCMMRR